MTLTIDLTPAEEARLQVVAREKGVALNECARQLLTEQLPDLTANGADAEAPQRTTPDKGGIRPPQKRPSAFGKYAFVAGGSEEFAKEKQAEIEYEDRARG